MKVILISGKSASGKDQFGKYLYDILDRKDLRVLTIHYADFVKYCCTQYYDWDGNKDVYGRSLLQRIGTDVVRKKFPSYWAECVAKFIAATQDDWDYVLIPDWRFINEYNITKYYNKDCTTVRVNRLNKDGTFFLNPLFTEEQNNHPSECELDDYCCDYTIDNSGMLEDLKDRAREFIKEIL